MAQAIIKAATESTKAATVAVREADYPVNSTRPSHNAHVNMVKLRYKFIKVHFWYN